MDPLHHPDLQRLGRKMRDQLEETLDEEQHAARAAVRRRLTLRDRLIEAEDRIEHLVVETTDGQLRPGLVDAVGADHIVLLDGDIQRFVSLAHVVSLEFR